MGTFVAAKMQFYCCDYGQLYRGKKRSFVTAKMGGFMAAKKGSFITESLRKAGSLFVVSKTK